MIIERELTGGLYYGTPRGITGEHGQNDARAVNTMAYTYAEESRESRGWHLTSPANAAKS